MNPPDDFDYETDLNRPLPPTPIEKIAGHSQKLLQQLAVHIANYHIVDHDDIDDDSLTEISCVFGGTIANMVEEEVLRRKTDTN